MVTVQSELLVNDYAIIPFKVITTLTSEVNYGGRVTDTWDRRLIANMVLDFCNEEALEEGYKFSPQGVYKTINGVTKEDYLKYIANELPVNASPEIFGLHENADITCAQNETYAMLTTILSLQPRASSGGGKSREELLDELAADLLSKAPVVFNLEVVADAYPTTYTESMNTVLQQECLRYNKVIAKIGASLKDIRKGAQGRGGDDGGARGDGHVALQQPGARRCGPRWPTPRSSRSPRGCPTCSAASTSSRRGSTNGKPAAFWISGFYFPQAFITGVMQNHARKYQLPIDTVTYGYNIVDEPVESIEQPPSDGAYIYGMFIEGARWDPENAGARRVRPKELYTELPMMHLLPIANA